MLKSLEKYFMILSIIIRIKKIGIFNKLNLKYFNTISDTTDKGPAPITVIFSILWPLLRIIFSQFLKELE